MENEIAYFPVSAKENINIDKILPEVTLQYLSLPPWEEKKPTPLPITEAEERVTFFSSLSNLFFSYVQKFGVGNTK